MTPSARELAEQIMADLVELGPRPHGSGAAKEAAEYLRCVLERLGFTVKEHAFSAAIPAARAELIIDLDGKAVGLEYEPFLEAAPGAASGRVVFDGYMRIWGTYEWECWSVREDGKAAAYLVACDLGEAIAQHLPPEVPDVPALVVSRASADLLRAATSAGQALTATIAVPARSQADGTCLRAFEGNDPLEVGGPSAPLVVAHYDTVPGSPGAYDNAAGAAAAVAAAAGLSRQHIPPHVLLTGAEELGLAGARSFVREVCAMGKVNKLSAAVVLDGGGRGRLAEAWLSAPQLDVGIVKAFREACDAHGYAGLVRRPAPPASDHVAFSEAGVQAVMYTVNDTAILHRRSDVFDERKVAASMWLAEAARRTVSWLTSQAHASKASSDNNQRSLHQ